MYVLQYTILFFSSSVVCSMYSQQYCIQSIKLFSFNSFQFAIFSFSNDYQQFCLQSTILFSSNSFQFAMLSSSNNYQQYGLQSTILLFSNSLQYPILPFSNTLPNSLQSFLNFSEFLMNLLYFLSKKREYRKKFNDQFLAKIDKYLYNFYIINYLDPSSHIWSCIYNRFD